MSSEPNTARPRIPGELLLLVTAAIWGFAFVAQRVGMQHVGPFTFNGIRFLLGVLLLVPVAFSMDDDDRPRRRASLIASLPVGAALAGAASLQQVGLVTTSAGNAGFITGLYVVIVPLLVWARGERPPALRLAAVVVAAAGLYLLAVTDGFVINVGDLWVLGSALLFAVHVLMIERHARTVSPLWFAIGQYLVVAVVSIAVSIVAERPSIAAITPALPAILYGGIGSIAIAYTLQIVGQRRVRSSHAVIVLSLEGLFAALGGALLIGEALSPRAAVGAALLLVSMIASQLVPARHRAR